jgi:predicted alpha/beta-fold hydrolase
VNPKAVTPPVVPASSPASSQTPPPAAPDTWPAFSPAFLLANRHLQTVWTSLLRRRPAGVMAQEDWRLPDGDPLTVHFVAEQPGRPGVLVLHGLEGSANARYVVGLLDRIRAAGWNGAAFDFRSCGRAAQRHQPAARGLYHAGKTDDLAFVIDRLRARWGPAPLGVVGFSLGGNVTLKWLGETGADNPITAAVTVSVPYDLGACAASIDAPGFWSTIYRERFLRSLRRKALGAMANHPGALEADAIRVCRTFAAYDGSVIARLFGFASAQDYWDRCSSRRFLPGIRRPTLLISGRNDPFIPPSAIPRDIIAQNPALTLYLAEGGGHVGFVAGSPLRPRYFADDLTIRFLAQHFAAAGAQGATASS